MFRLIDVGKGCRIICDPADIPVIQAMESRICEFSKPFYPYSNARWGRKQLSPRSNNSNVRYKTNVEGDGVKNW